MNYEGLGKVNFLIAQIYMKKIFFKNFSKTYQGNIEGGFGSFAVYNTTDITLLEWETYEYREKEE